MKKKRKKKESDFPLRKQSLYRERKDVKRKLYIAWLFVGFSELLVLQAISDDSYSGIFV